MAQITYWDYDSLARLDSQGSIKIFNGNQAVANALRNWIRSFEGEYIRRPTLGGIIVKILMKPISENTASKIRTLLMDGLVTYFTPTIRTREITVTPIYDRGYYDIYIEGYVPFIKEKLNYADKLKNLV